MYKKGRAYRPDSTGEKNPAAKLTEADVKKIRELKKTNIKNIELMEMFGVSRAAIKRANNRKAWSHVK